jgi:hypothetical protein
MSELLNLITHISTPIIALNQTLTMFYSNAENTITKIVVFIKILVVLITFGYLYYLYFYKKQYTIQSSVLLLLLLNGITFIMFVLTIYFMFSKVPSPINNTPMLTESKTENL